MHLHMCMQQCLVCAKYVKTTSTLGIGTADSTRIICTLAHIGWTRESHHHSTRSPPSFLTGLEEKKREREGVQGRNCSFPFCRWHSCYYNLAEIIEVVKLLPVSPSVFIHLCLSSFQTRCKFEEAQSTLVKQFLKRSELAHGKHGRCLTRRCTLPLHGSLMSLIHEIFFHQQSTPPSGVCTEQISGCSKE